MTAVVRELFVLHCNWARELERGKGGGGGSALFNVSLIDGDMVWGKEGWREP